MWLISISLTKLLLKYVDILSPTATPCNFFALKHILQQSVTHLLLCW